MAFADELIRRSTKAQCGAFEREVTVRPENLLKAKLALRKKGLMIVGTSERKDKIWFVNRATALL